MIDRKNTVDNMANKDLNRLKLLLVEKKKQANGLPNNLVRFKPLFQSGAPIAISLMLRA